ncbi:MAG: efflux RND transporter periplasmic adaptor subunit [Candidatus Omnitrophota bacterium]
MKNLRLVSAVLISFVLGIAVARGVLNKGVGKNSEADTRHKEEAAELSLSEESQELINLKTAITRLSVFKKMVSVFGQIAQDVQTSVHVVSPVTGTIIDVKAQIGSSVKKDEILCVVSKINGETSPYEVKAPIAGTVIGAFAKANDRVDTVSSIYTIADLTKLWATLEVYEKDIAEIRLGQKVSARAVAYPDKVFEGEIVFISPRVDETSHTIKIRVIVDNKDMLLKLGMFISGDIISEGEEKYLSVPADAVQTMGEDRIVFLKTEGNKFVVRKIKVKAETEEEVFIDNVSSQEETTRIKEGDEVAVEGAFLLKSELLKGELEEE